MLRSHDEENDRLLVETDEASSLKSVKTNWTTSLYDLSGKRIELYHLDEGDTVKLHYYKRYSSYKPIDIHVERLIVEKEIKDLTATITNIDFGTSNLSVDIENLESLKTIYYIGQEGIFDLRGMVIPFEFLEVGDQIQTYYSHYENYELHSQVDVKRMSVDKYYYEFQVTVESVNVESNVINVLSEESELLETIFIEPNKVFDLNGTPISIEDLEAGG